MSAVSQSRRGAVTWVLAVLAWLTGTVAVLAVPLWSSSPPAPLAPVPVSLPALAAVPVIPGAVTPVSDLPVTPLVPASTPITPPIVVATVFRHAAKARDHAGARVTTALRVHQVSLGALVTSVKNRAGHVARRLVPPLTGAVAAAAVPASMPTVDEGHDASPGDDSRGEDHSGDH